MAQKYSFVLGPINLSYKLNFHGLHTEEVALLMDTHFASAHFFLGHVPFVNGVKSQ